ncbi:MAG: hypothetical protein M3R18_03625, partial [Pseudomonadota bacterium]|nr:hypothetical protein [Pseudomonadota bacterium]
DAARDKRKTEEVARPKPTAKAAARDKRAKVARRYVNPNAGYALGDDMAPAYADPYDGQPRILRRNVQPQYVQPRYGQPQYVQPQEVQPGYVYGRRGYADVW